eukprot:TRINITY_DN6001_c0_g1_i2.p1 TRINITY_DN6001_c0_g1~~TRINITY_DN6001_c0_g1_i2.p1  ORF type:complete len:188 (-),score=50.65 TRINITY_DN6001_c0_g1_i2:163-726(-)
MGKETKPQYSQKRVRQYLVVGRAKPSDAEPEPKVYRMRVFAPNTVVAKSRFWTLMRKQKKIKHSHGQLVALHEIHENDGKSVKVFGLVIRYQSRTGYHNMYKEYRDTSLCGAISQMYMDMAGRHRARGDTIHVIRTAVIPPGKEKRGEIKIFTEGNPKFPLLNKISRPPIKKYKTFVHAKRPALFNQ